MNRILTTLILSTLCVVTFTCVCATNDQDKIYSNHVSKEKVVYITPSFSVHCVRIKFGQLSA